VFFCERKEPKLDLPKARKRAARIRWNDASIWPICFPLRLFALGAVKRPPVPAVQIVPVVQRLSAVQCSKVEGNTNSVDPSTFRQFPKRRNVQKASANSPPRRGGHRQESKRAKVSDRDCLDRRIHHVGAEDADLYNSLNLQPIAAASCGFRKELILEANG